MPSISTFKGLKAVVILIIIFAFAVALFISLVSLFLALIPVFLLLAAIGYLIYLFKKKKVKLREIESKLSKIKEISGENCDEVEWSPSGTMLAYATAVGEYINATEFTKFLNKAYKHLNWKELFALGANEIILDSLSKASSETAKSTEISTFSSEISRCKAYNTDKTTCEGAGCSWQ